MLLTSQILHFIPKNKTIVEVGWSHLAVFYEIFWKYNKKTIASKLVGYQDEDISEIDESMQIDNSIDRNRWISLVKTSKRPQLFGYTIHRPIN